MTVPNVLGAKTLLISLLIPFLASFTESRAEVADATTGMVENPCQGYVPKAQAEIDKERRDLQPGAIFVSPMPITPEQAANGEKAQADRRAADWPDLCHYRAENASKDHAPDIVFVGDSITELWGVADPIAFSGRIANRGISGQTSAQLLLRFYSDVVALHPARVHILVGTNDVAGNTGPTSLRAYQNNMIAMVELARANNIKVIIGAVPPASRFWWAPGYHPAETLKLLNTWLASYCREEKITFVNYYDALTDGAGAFRPDLSNDGVHPNTKGYAIMETLARRSTGIEDHIPSERTPDS